MKKFQTIVIFFVIFLVGLFVTQAVRADTVIDNGINYLKSKQDPSGRITTGFSAPSQWSAIAFTANGFDVSTIKNGTLSLKDFLLTDLPSEPSAATDWETRILAIVAIGENPTNFGGTNYVQKLEGFYKDNQIGDTCSLNDDIFGLLALIASGSTSNSQIKQDTLNFLISKQDPTDGGFGFSAPGCAWYSTSADITAAAAHALQAAKDNGISNAGLDEAITKARNYLLTNQNGDGGFGYYGASDTDTTGWVIIAFNALGMKDSEQAVKAHTWLISQQSPTDGGFMAFDYSLNTSVSNASTTAQALIGLTGKTWILKVFTLSTTITPTQTPIATIPPTSSSPTPTSSPSQSSSCSDTNPGIPVITEAVISDSTSVILKWKRAPNTVDHYLLAYGNSENSLSSGNSNIGGKDATSFEIKKLIDGTTYYFKLKAINGCTSGDFSNTAIVTLGENKSDLQNVSKKTISPTSEVLGTSAKQEISNSSINKKTESTPPTVSNQNPINKGLLVFSFLSFSGAIVYWYFKLKIS